MFVLHVCCFLNTSFLKLVFVFAFVFFDVFLKAFLEQLFKRLARRQTFGPPAESFLLSLGLVGPEFCACRGQVSDTNTVMGVARSCFSTRTVGIDCHIHITSLLYLLSITSVA